MFKHSLEFLVPPACSCAICVTNIAENQVRESEEKIFLKM